MNFHDPTVRHNSRAVESAIEPATAPPPADNRGKVVGVIGIDLVLPFATYYGLRLLGADPWLALMLGAVGPLIRIMVSVIRTRRLERLSLFTLSIMTVGTLVGLLGGDARLLMARESWLTAAIGVWLLVSLMSTRPILFTATIAVLPPHTAQEWQRNWHTDPTFRGAFRWLTIGWGSAFILDAIARVVMAYTLPLDLVPIASVGLLIVLLVVINEAVKLYGRRVKRQTSEEPLESDK